MKSLVYIRQQLPIPFLLALIFILSFSACVKDERSCIARSGKGGLTVQVYPVYKGQPVESTKTYKDTVYVKYGASSFPGNNMSKYELKVVTPEGKSSVNVSKLNCGVYYFFVVCQDTVSGNRLTGGASFISDKITGDFNLVIPVDVN